MSDFEDRALRDSLQRLAGHPGDETAAYAALQQRVRQVKRRRAVAGAGSLAALLIGGLAVVGVRNHSRESLTPATDGLTVPSIDARVPKTMDTNDARIATDQTITTDPTTTDASASTALDATTSAVTTGPDPTQSLPNTGGASHTNQPVWTTDSASGTGSTGSSAAVTGSADPQTFNAKHGSITVTFLDGQLSITGYTAESGFTYTVERTEPTRIRVRFRHGDTRSQIDVTIIDGRMFATPSEQAGTVTTSPPFNTASPSTAPSTSATASTLPDDGSSSSTQPPPSSTAPDGTAPTTTDDHHRGGDAGSGSIVPGAVDSSGHG